MNALTRLPKRLGTCLRPIQSWNPAREAPGEDFCYIDLGSVDNGRKVIAGAQRISGKAAPSRARQLVQAGDILVSTVRPYLNGVALVPSELDGATASTGFCVLRPDPLRADASYLFHWVRSPAFVADMIRKSTGASYPAVSDRIIHDSLAPLPPLSHQKRIAAILDQADGLRRERELVAARARQIGPAIFYEMFGDVRSNDLGWPDHLTVGDLCEVVSGITKGRKLNGQAVRPVPYMTVATVQDGFLKLDTVKSIEATDQEIKRYRLEPSDILLTEGGDPDKLGRGAMWSGELSECIHQNHVFRVRVVDERLHPVFATWLLGSSRGKAYFLRSAKQTTGIASINSSQLKAFPLLLPPPDIQALFAVKLERLKREIRMFDLAAAEQEALFNSLQHRAFRGEL